MLSCSVDKKWKLSLLVISSLIRLIPGSCSNFLIAILTGLFKPKFWFERSFVLIPSKLIPRSMKQLNELATLDSSEIISPFSTSNIFGKVVTLADKHGLTVSQNSLLSLRLFKYILYSIFFLSCLYNLLQTWDVTFSLALYF